MGMENVLGKSAKSQGRLIERISGNTDFIYPGIEVFA